MKTKDEIYALMNANPRFHLATMDNGQPRVRGLLLFKADEHGVIFHTGTSKDLHQQVQANPAVEMCFFSPQTGEQLRVAGKLTQDSSPVLIDEIYNHPSRAFLRNWGEGIKGQLAVYRLCNGQAYLWSMSSNFEGKEYIDI